MGILIEEESYNNIEQIIPQQFKCKSGVHCVFNLEKKIIVVMAGSQRGSEERRCA